MAKNIPTELLELLNSAVKSGIEEYDVEIINNEQKGEGFVGDVIFVNLTKKTSQVKKQFVLKQERQTNGEAPSFVRVLFNNEICFYDEILPEMKKFYRDLTNKEIDFVPHCCGVLTKDVNKILLENLTSKGFKTYEKASPFDDDHFRLIFRTYGIFHGISMAIRELDSQLYNKLISPLHAIRIKCFADNRLPSKTFTKMVKTAQGFFDPNTEKDILLRLRECENVGPKLIDDCLNDGYTEGIITHGDCWSNNLMFKYNEAGKPEAVNLIDFQLVGHGSPVYDLSYCLYSAGIAKNFDNLNNYLQIYHSSLSQTLSEFKLNAETIYPLSKLKEEWKKYCKFGFGMSLLIWKIKLIDKNAVPDITATENRENIEFQIADDKQDQFRQVIKDLFLHMFSNDFI